MVSTVMENVRGFFNSRPPLVVFMICLGSFAISLITFAYIVKVKDIKDPNVTEDWNTFLEKFSHLEFCVCQNSTTNATEGRLSVVDQDPASVIKNIPNKLSHSLGFPSKDTKDRNAAVHIARRAIQTTAAEQNSAYQQAQLFNENHPSVLSPSRTSTQKNQMMNVTVNLRFRVEPNANLHGLTLSLTQFVGSMFPNSLNMEHKSTDKEKIYVTMSFPQNLSQSQCERMVGNTCSEYSVTACVTFSAPAHLLPNTRKPDQETCKSYAEPTVDFSVRNMSVGTLSDTSSSHWCEHGARLTPEFSLDDSLTMFLSLHDKSMINLHLMRTSYFLFVMVLTLFCYAMIKGRPAKVKTVHVTYDKLNASSQP